jgi:hypothetical protein
LTRKLERCIGAETFARATQSRMLETVHGPYSQGKYFIFLYTQLQANVTFN